MGIADGPLSRAARARRWGQGRAGWLAGAGMLLAYFLWTVSSTGAPFDFGENRADYFNLLADGFLDGRLSLPVEPPPELLALDNPYDPEANKPYRLHDASLYEGRYYLQWGPTPVLVLYLPFRLLPLGDVPQTLAVALFAFVGACFAVALLRELVRRLAPGAPAWMVALGAVGVVAGSALPFTLRRAAIYEVAICSAFCFMFAGLYLLVMGLPSSGRPLRLRRLALASLCFGLAVGCRPTMVLPALLPVLALVWLVRRGNVPRAQHGRLAAALAGPLAACAVLLAVYNALRFGSPFEFGQRYQLAGIDPQEKDSGDLAYLAPGAWYYLLARAHLTVAFPFFHLPPPPESFPGTLPEGYEATEPTGGLVANVPIAVLALVPWFALRGGLDRRLSLVVAGIAALGAALLLLISYTLYGSTMRYEVDFAALLVLAAVLAWIGLVVAARRRVVRRALAVAGTLALGWGIVYGVAVGMTGYYDGLLGAQPGTFERLERLAGPVATGLALIDGGPQVARVQPGERLTRESDPGAGIGGPLDLVVAPGEATVVHVVAPRHRSVAVTMVVSTRPRAGAPPLLRITTPQTRVPLELLPTGQPQRVELPLRRGLNRIVLRSTAAELTVSGVTLGEEGR